MVRKAKVSLAFILSLQNLKSLLGDNVIAEMTKHATVFPPTGCSDYGERREGKDVTFLLSAHKLRFAHACVSWRR